jgi:hypothetical protein
VIFHSYVSLPEGNLGVLTSSANRRTANSFYHHGRIHYLILVKTWHSMANLMLPSAKIVHSPSRMATPITEEPAHLPTNLVNIPGFRSHISYMLILYSIYYSHILISP